jgi:uncharacterized paraquat-inducible protein A
VEVEMTISVEQLPQLSRRNRDAVKSAQHVGCYFCIEVFNADAVTDYDNGGSALCPRCGVDALLPDVTDKALLAKACESWFVGKALERVK